MNFLAHIYLSGDDELVKIGNFMADGIKGKQYLDYPQAVQNGILLHRKIDDFTDSHPLFRQSRKRLAPDYGHYSGVVTDMFYDYFLAKYWKNYCRQPLTDYAADFYHLLEKNSPLLNDRTQKMLPYMQQENWLSAYATHGGLQKILQQMDNRTGFRSGMRNAIVNLAKDEKLYEAEFFEFFPQVQEMAARFLAV
ncbi:MAG: acyl carrier protein phosphodiesterase [Capnocytophaga sp.]|nr:acyl carrier protein phosphodiesterase [Capnocytophaga sp.]